MMDKNIFIAKYENEDAWTERLMKFLANSNARILNSFFKLLDIGIKIRSMDKVSFDMQEVEKDSRPDATISSYDNYFIVHFEMKTGEGFNLSQAENHLSALVEKNNKIKVLVIMTKDLNEPITFTRFLRENKKSPVKIKFVSWNNVADFVCSIPKKETDKRIKFLASQYSDFIEKEVKPELKWTGFEKDFLVKWKNFYNFRNEISKLLDNEIAPYIKKHLEHKWPDFKKDPQPDSIGFEKNAWTLWSRRKAWLSIEFGFSGDDEFVTAPSFFIAWEWSWSVHEKLKNRLKFSQLIKKIEAKKFIYEDNFVERDLDIIDICKLPVNNQLKKIFNFIDNSITIFEESELIKLIKK